MDEMPNYILSSGKGKIQEVAELMLGTRSNVTAKFTDDLF